MKRNILVIEDDPGIRNVLALFLESEGFHTVTLPDGLAALQFLEQDCGVDLILLDLRMPGMDGRDFRKKQLENPRIADIPVIVMSADRAAGKVGSDIRAFGVITKPFDPDELLRSLAEVFGSPSRGLVRGAPVENAALKAQAG